MSILNCGRYHFLKCLLFKNILKKIIFLILVYQNKKNKKNLIFKNITVKPQFQIFFLIKDISPTLHYFISIIMNIYMKHKTWRLVTK
jgi:hypothetical protein